MKSVKKQTAGGRGPGVRDSGAASRGQSSAATVGPRPSLSPNPYPRTSFWLWPAAALGALIAAFWAYGPALHGPFLFDDATLPFVADPDAPLNLRGNRPVLMFTYWLTKGQDAYAYHLLGVIFHLITAALVFLIVRRLLEWSGAARHLVTPLAAFAASIFLLHPAQTEAVAYIAGRSETVSVMLAFAAFCVFLYRPKAGWGTVAAIVLLFGAALLSKEHIVVLPALLLLTDYWWNPGFSFKGVRAHWKLYATLAAGALAGVPVLLRVFAGAKTAGFGLKDFTWYQYFFTQCRALFVYVRIFLLPVNLTADWDFSPSRTIFEHGAILGLAALIALAVVAWIYRRRFPLASYGFFVYLLLMSPTSSILPIQDAVAERRLYFSMLGLLLIVVAVLSRLKLDRKALATAAGFIVLFAAIATHARAEVWSDPIKLWEDTAQKSPRKWRAHFQLGFAYYEQQRYDLAVQSFEKASQVHQPDYGMLVDWGLALDGLGRSAEGLEKLREAAALDRTAHVYSQICMLNAKQSQWEPALEACNEAIKIDPKFVQSYVYIAEIHLRRRECREAVEYYKKARDLAPGNEQVRNELPLAERCVAETQK